MEGKNLLQFLHEEAVLDMGMMNRRNWLRKNSRGSANSPKPLFLKKNNIKKKNLCSLKDCLKPGYAIEVTAITSKTLRKRYTYVGTIIAIRRRGKSLGQRNSFQSFFVKQIFFLLHGRSAIVVFTSQHCPGSRIHCILPHILAAYRWHACA